MAGSERKRYCVYGLEDETLLFEGTLEETANWLNLGKESLRSVFSPAHRKVQGTECPIIAHKYIVWKQKYDEGE